MMRRIDIEGLTPEQIADKFALDYVPTRITSVTPPPGAEIRVGKANENFNRPGGGVQFQLLDGLDIYEDWEWRDAKPLR